MEDLEKMQVPDPDFQPDQSLKKTILSTQTSSRIGIPLIIVPGTLLFSMILKEELGISLGITNAIGNFVESLDRYNLSPVIFALFPLIAITLFFLAMTHFSFDKKSKLLQISIKFKFLNIFLILLAGSIFGTVMIYLILENLNHAAV